MKKRAFIIAEAGVNHNGRIDIAEKLIDVAAGASADAVKFQCFKAKDLVLESAEKAAYQKKNKSGESQYQMLKMLELNEDQQRHLSGYCSRKKIMFLSSPFDTKSIDFLYDLGLEIFKIPSGEINNRPYLKKIGSLNKKVILSTGLANLGEIEEALNILTENGTFKKNITVLHCHTEYPTPMEFVNLRAMQTIKHAFDISVGYSDHTVGIEIPIAAVALGAEVIEKHFTIDKQMEGPDHASSIDPSELVKMVSSIRNIEKAMGDGIKRPTDSEMKNFSAVRKSIVTTKKILKGQAFSDDNITAKRPGTGISPGRWEEIVGRKALRDFDENEFVEV